MFGFEIINDCFVCLLWIGIFNFMWCMVEIFVSQVKVQKYSEFICNLLILINLNLVYVKLLCGMLLFVFDLNFVFFVVDNLFGGDGCFYMCVEGCDFMVIEQWIIGKLLNFVFEYYMIVWKSVWLLQFEFVCLEMYMQFVNVVMLNEIVIVMQFLIEFGLMGGMLYICMLYLMIELICDVFSLLIQGEVFEVDCCWVCVLFQQVQVVEVELIVNFVEILLMFEKILNLCVGDVLLFEIEDMIIVKVDGVLVMECGYGIFNG